MPPGHLTLARPAPSMNEALNLRSLASRLSPPNGRRRSASSVGSWACPAELRARWDQPTVEGEDPLERALARLSGKEGRGPGREALLDLRGASLAGRDLEGLDLSGADLRGADLSGARLADARLFRAHLDGAVLIGAELDGADLTGADLHGANLEGASAKRAGFGRAILIGVRAHGIQLADAVLTDANCRDADFSGADFSGARLSGAELLQVDLVRARLDGVDLSGCRVAGASFQGASLRGSVLRGVTGYEQANWIGVDLREADFAGAYMMRRFVMDQNFIEEFRTRGRFNAVLHWAWWITSDCGRSFLRWSLWTLAWTLLFTGLYSGVEIDFGDNETWISPLYFSVVTVTTLGYGDALPVSAVAQALVVVQVTVGYMMLGGLISIMSNKLARRAE